MHTTTRTEERIQEVRRIFEQHGFGNIVLLDDWDGEEIEELEDFLTEEEFQTLLDALAGSDEDR